MTLEHTITCQQQNDNLGTRVIPLCIIWAIHNNYPEINPLIVKKKIPDVIN